MLDGKMLRGLTGTPMRRMALANSSLADADPEPLTLANLTTKSLMDSIGAWVGVMRGLAGMTSQGRSPLQRYSCRLRSEEHTSELQSLMRISYAVFCLKKKNINRSD